jgi:hypothetical protein
MRFFLITNTKLNEFLHDITNTLKMKFTCRQSLSVLLQAQGTPPLPTIDSELPEAVLEHQKLSVVTLQLK